jgi:hypothetical protein
MSPPEVQLTREEIVHLLDEVASRFGKPAAEILRAYRAGQFGGDSGEIADLLVLADLLAEDDPFFDAA